MVESALNIALGFLAVGLVVCSMRLFKGPSLLDRLLAVETAALIVGGIFAILAIQSSSEFIIGALVLSTLGVISSVAVSRYLVNGRPF